MNRRIAFGLGSLLVAITLVGTACTSSTPNPTSAPSKTTAAPAASPTTAPAAAASPTAAPAAQAQPNYPTKPVNFIIPIQAGDVADVGARLIAGIAEKNLGQQLVIMNKGGAGWQVGLTELVQQKPDGYSIGLIAAPRLNTLILDKERKTVFGLDDFTYIISQVVDPGAIFVKADSPYKTFKDLIDSAKKDPEKIRLGGVSLLSDDHLLALMVQQATQAKFRVVNFQAGNADQLAAILGGHIDAACDNVGALAARSKTGDVRVLAVADQERSKFLPDVPTMAELGYPTVISSSTRAIVGPKGMPEPIVKVLQDAFLKAMQDPGYIDKMEKEGMSTAKPMLGDALRKYIASVHERIQPLMEAALTNR